MKRSKPLLAWLAGTLFVIVLALVFALRPRTRVVNEADAPKPKSRQDVLVTLKSFKEISSLQPEPGAAAFSPPPGKSFVSCNLTITNENTAAIALKPSDFVMSAKDGKWYFSHFAAATAAGAPRPQKSLPPGSTVPYDVVFIAVPGVQPKRIDFIDRTRPDCANCPS